MAREPSSCRPFQASSVVPALSRPRNTVFTRRPRMSNTATLASVAPSSETENRDSVTNGLGLPGESTRSSESGGGGPQPVVSLTTRKSMGQCCTSESPSSLIARSMT